MSKLLVTAVLILMPALAGAVPVRPDHRAPSSIFTAAELNNLAGMDDPTSSTRVRRMQTEIAVLRDQVGRMKLDRLIDTVLTGDHRPAGGLTH